MRRALLTLLLVCGACFGQGQNTTFQQVIKNASVSPTTSAPIQNIGQMYHRFQAGLKNAPGHTCATTSFNLTASVSDDGTNFYPPLAGNGSAGQQVIGTVGGSPYTIFKELKFSGAWPQIEASVNTFDTTNCVIDVFYAGTVSLEQFGHILQTFSQVVSAAGDTTIITPTSNGIGIAGMVLYNQTAAQSVFFRSGTAGAKIPGLEWDGLAASTVVSLPPLFSGAYGQTSFGGSATNLVVNLANATAVTVTLLYYNY